MTRIEYLAIATTLVFSVGSPVQGADERGNPVVHVTWAFQAQTLAELAEEADLIVVAEHALSRPGRVAGRGEGRVPYTIQGFRVLSVFKGNVEDQILLVEQTGGTLPGGQSLHIDDGGPFEPGQRYLLFLKDQGTGLYYQLNDQGRFEIRDDRLVGVRPRDEVVATLHGRRVGEGLRKVRAAAEAARAPY